MKSDPVGPMRVSMVDNRTGIRFDKLQPLDPVLGKGGCLPGEIKVVDHEGTVQRWDAKRIGVCDPGVGTWKYTAQPVKRGDGVMLSGDIRAYTLKYPGTRPCFATANG